MITKMSLKKHAALYYDHRISVELFVKKKNYEKKSFNLFISLHSITEI